MYSGKTTLARVALAAVLALLMAGCAGRAPASDTAQDMLCLPNEVVVCRGGTVSKIGNSKDREPRFCQCRPRNDIDF